MFLEERVESLKETIQKLQNEIRFLKKQSADEYLTPKEFAHRMKFSENTVYCWIREGKIETLPNLGSAYRIPMSQFYKKNKIAEEVEANTKKKKNRSEQLKEEFLASLREG